jgi:hypothetical protein
MCRIGHVVPSAGKENHGVISTPPAICVATEYSPK